MKPATLFSILLAWCQLQLAAQPNSVPRVSGIIDLPDLKQALFEQRTPRAHQLVLSFGQNEEGIELLEVSQRHGVVVKLSGNADPITLKLHPQTNIPVGSTSGIILDRAALQLVLHTYSHFGGRTLLQ